MAMRYRRIFVLDRCRHTLSVCLGLDADCRLLLLKRESNESVLSLVGARSYLYQEPQQPDPRVLRDTSTRKKFQIISRH